MSGAQGASRIGGNELDLNLLFLAHFRRTVEIARLRDVAQQVLPTIFGETKVDEAGPCDLTALEQTARIAEAIDETLRNFARRFAQALGQRHRDVGREVTVVFIAWNVEGRRGNRFGVASFCQQFAERFLELL